MRFAVPGDWAPARIGKQYLLFESETGPTMEIKWGRAKGSFSHRRRLPELARRIGRRRRLLQERALSAEWRVALSKFEVAGFHWEAADEQAVGVLLYCPTCRTASLIQFFDRCETAPSVSNSARVLASFCDHRRDGRVAWALYDIIAFLPESFSLERHRFEAGRFILSFKGRRCRLALYRWAPAAVLLQNRSLADFAGTIYGGKEAEVRSLTIAGYPGVEVCDPSPVGWPARVKTGLGMAWFRRLRVWQVDGRNRILGAGMEARRPIEAREMDGLSESYGMDDETEKQSALESI